MPHNNASQRTRWSGHQFFPHRMWRAFERERYAREFCAALILVE